MNEILPFIAAVAALFFFWGIDLAFRCRNKNSHRACQLLCIITLFWFLCIVKDILGVLLNFNDSLEQLSVSIDILTIPLTSFYVFEITCPGWGNRKRYFQVLAPWIILVGFYMISFHFFAAATDFLFYLLTGTAIGYVLFMLRFVYIHKKRYQQLIENNLSFDENISIRWIDIVKYAFLWDCIIFFLCTVFPLPWTNIIYYTSISISWWILYHFTCRQEKIPIDEENLLDENKLETMEPEESIPDSQESSPHSERLNEIGERMDRIMEKEKLYLQPNLTLPDLASAIASNKTYVYQYLKQSRNLSFSDYINSLRIERKAIPLMRLSVEKSFQKGIPELSVNEIAFESGFQSLSTFRRAFLKVTGCNASVYIKNLRKQAMDAGRSEDPFSQKPS